MLFPALLSAQMGLDNNKVAIKSVDSIPVIALVQEPGLESQPVYQLSKWLTYANHDSVKLGIIPANGLMESVFLNVNQAFNSSGTDLLTCGYSSDKDAYIVSEGVNTTGVHTGINGADVQNVTGTARTVYAYYTHGGTAPTEGKALIVIYWTQVEAMP